MPEPPAIESTYHFLRALFVRHLRKSLARERYKLRVVERVLKELPPLPTPLEIVAACERQDHAVAELATQHLGRLRPRLVVSKTRLRSDVELGPAMHALSARYLGVDLDYLGHVEHDDAVWLTVRRKQAAPHRQPRVEGRAQRRAHRAPRARA